MNNMSDVEKMSEKWIRRRRLRRRDPWISASAIAGGTFLFAGVLFAAPVQPPKELPGIISSNEAYSGLVALKPADIQFYLKSEHAALDRYQHPTAGDLKDIAEANQLHHLEIVGSAKMMEALKAGKGMQEAAAAAFQPTREQKAVMDRGDELTNGVESMLAREAGMPRDQWDRLKDAVENAASLNDTTNGPRGYGSADDSPTPRASSAQIAAAAQAAAERSKVKAADRQLVAPSAAEIKKVHDLIMPIVRQRTQAMQAAMTP